MAINLNMRAPVANPLSFAQVDSNFAQLKTAIEDLQKNASLTSHNHNGQYYLKSEIDGYIKSVWDELGRCIKQTAVSASEANTIKGNNQYWGCIETSHIGKIQWGMAIVPANNQALSTISVQYPKPYQTFAPVLMVNSSAPARGPAEGWYAQAVAVNNTVTGFTIAVDTLAGMGISQPVPVTWIAFLSS